MKNRLASRRLLVVALAAMPIALVELPGLSAQETQKQIGTSDARDPATAPDEQPAFEVTSVKRDTTDAMVQLGGPDISRFVARNVTAKDLIEFAYDLREFQFSGGPSWIATEKFDADGEVEDSLAEKMRALPHEQQQDELRLMVRSLLGDRFKLAVRHETKQLPIYTLVVAKEEPTLKEVDAPDPKSSVPFAGPPAPGGSLPAGEVLLSIFANGTATIAGKASSMPNFVGMLSMQLGRHVEDDTKLKGSYDFLLSYSRDGLSGGPMIISPNGAAVQNSGGMSIFTAIQEQLGLKLESGKGPVDTIVIDHIEEPSAN